MQNNLDNLDFALADWKKGFYNGLININKSIGYEQKKLIEDLDVFEVIGILNLVATDDYAPTIFFEDGKANFNDTKLSLKVSNIKPNEEYPIIRLNLKTQDMSEAAYNNGGLLFEDPLIALASAKAVSMTLEAPRGFIASPNCETLFALRPKMLELLKQRFFDGKPLFIEAEDYCGEFNLPSFDIVFLQGSDIINLRDYGQASCLINNELLFSEMYAK